MYLIAYLLKGSRAKEIAPFWGDIVPVISDPFIIDCTSERVHTAATALLSTLLSRMVGHGKAAIEGHFLLRVG